MVGGCTPSKQATFHTTIQATQHATIQTSSDCPWECLQFPGDCRASVHAQFPGNFRETVWEPGSVAVGARAAGQTHLLVLLLRLLSDYSDLASWLAWWAVALGYLHTAQQLRQVPRNIPGKFPEASGRAWRGRCGGRGRERRDGQGGCTGLRMQEGLLRAGLTWPGR